MGPAGVVPVAAEVRGLEGHDDQVARARFDPLVAAGAEVALHRLERLDAPDLYLGPSPAAHKRRSATTTKAAATNT